MTRQNTYGNFVPSSFSITFWDKNINKFDVMVDGEFVYLDVLNR